MFTGIIEGCCRVASIRGGQNNMQITVELGPLADGVEIGHSIAVSGVCLTVVRLRGSLADFDISGETLCRAKPVLSALKPSSLVNIERAMKSDGRFGGHFVTGHVDAAATVKSVEHNGDFARMVFTADAQLLSQMVVKGSVTVDGVSLTIADMDDTSFTAALIPQTLNSTTLGRAKVGDCVNIETDIIIKAINKRLAGILPPHQSLTVEQLKELGF